MYSPLLIYVFSFVQVVRSSFELIKIVQISKRLPHELNTRPPTLSAMSQMRANIYRAVYPFHRVRIWVYLGHNLFLQRSPSGEKHYQHIHNCTHWGLFHRSSLITSSAQVQRTILCFSRLNIKYWISQQHVIYSVSDSADTS